MKSNIRLIIRIAVIMVPVVALGYFIYSYINPSGTLEIEYDFCHNETPYISGLSPHGRVLDLNFEKCKQDMMIDPVYFDIRLPQSYRTATLEVELEKDDTQDIRIGIGIDPDNWVWDFAENVKCDLRPEMGSRGMKCFALNVSHAQFKNHRYRFIVSTPGLDESGEKITLYNMKLQFEKEPLNLSNTLPRLKSVIFQN